MSQRLPSEVFVPPLPSFPVPVAPPLTDGEAVALCIPVNWIPYIRGALQQLIQPTTWIGTEEEIKAAQETAATIIAMMEEGACAATGGVPTPFWDEAQDVDDEATPEEQAWYGEVTDEEAPADEITFVENIGIWAITGFIAYSGQIGAAIFFNTIAPRFVLAFHKGDIREIWRVVVDSAEYGRVDTDDYSAGDVIEMSIFADEELTDHDIVIMKVAP